MPNRKTHLVGSFGMVGMIGIYAALLPMEHAIPMALGVATGFAVTPDLDQEGPGGFRKQRGLWNKYWYPYGKAFQHSDSSVSHWPIVGTFTRVVYLLWLPMGIILVWYPDMIGRYWQISLAWFAGLCLADLFHVVLDKAFKG